MGKLFGTDGIRGVANTELSALLALKLGAASAYVLRSRHEGAQIFVGRDPRISGDILESALASGVCSLGVDVYLLGIVPTPGVAYLTRLKQADAGVVISASHNPMRDNGIKFFGSDGYKLSDEVENEIEKQLKRFNKLPRPEGNSVGRMYRAEEMVENYLDHLKGLLPNGLSGWKLALDCANGAVSHLAPKLFTELGANVMVINNSPNGININENCGSLYPETLQKLVKKENLQMGMSFDGDGDRAILIDEKGNIVDGDHVMAICALELARKDKLPGRKVVATVMSNAGLEVALARESITLLRTDVGDRYVSDKMRQTGAIIGGEKSGHIIFSEHSTTGDGMVTALQVLSVMAATGKPLSELAAQMSEFPQLLVNVPVRTKKGWEKIPEIADAVAWGQAQLAGGGRVFVRASGTEALIRVMAEGPDIQVLNEIVNPICEAIRKQLGQSE